MRKITQILAALVLMTLLLTLFVGCTDKCEDDGATLDYSGIELDSYIKLGEYVGLEIELESEGSSKSETVWKIAVDSAVVLDYPKAALEYYKKLVTERHELAKKLAEYGSPMNVMSNLGDEWDWIKSPWPWEYEANV